MHDLERIIRRIARRERRLLLAQALGIVASVSAVAVLSAGLLDYVVHFEEVELRWLVSLGVVTIIGFVVWRYLWPVLRFRRSSVSTALCIERCFPALADRLSSAVAFLDSRSDKETAGSQALRASLVSQVHSELERYPLAQCLSPRPLARSATLAGLALLALVLAAAAQPAAAQHAARRLAMPWNKLAWPRRNHLAFVDPRTHLGPGQDFEAIVIDRNNRLPEAVEIQYWFPGDPPTAIVTRPMRFAGGRMIHRLANVQRGFRYRAIGGDDDTMPWIELSLVEPPQLAPFAVRVSPPAYAARAAYEASGPIQALVGSTLTMEARADRPLRQVTLHAQPPQTLAFDPAELTPPNAAPFREFRLEGSDDKPITVQQTGTYWLDLTDDQGRRFSTQRWELQAIADEPPVVRLATISSTNAVTASAILPLDIAARDDLRVDAIELQISTGDGQPQTTVLWQRDITAEATPSSGSGAEQRITTEWDLGPLELEVGSTVDVRAIARDSKGQVAESPAQRLRIIGEEELDERFVQAQATIVARLGEILRVQREAMQQASSLHEQFAETEQLGRAQADQLQSAELTQRRVGQMIGDGNDSLLSHVDGLLRQFDVNQTSSAPIRDRLDHLVRELTDLRQHALPAIQRELLSASKLVPRSLTDPAPVPEGAVERLAAATAEQQRVIERLEALAAQLGEWENYQRLVREIEQIAGEQTRIEGETVGIQPETLGRNVLDLPPVTRAGLKRLARRQSELARRLEHLLSRLEAKQRTLAATDSAAAQELADGLALARRDQIAAAMRTSSSDLDENRLADALGEQRRTIDALTELADTLLHRGTIDPAAREQQLNAAREQVEQLHRRQEDLRAAQQELAGQGDRAPGPSQAAQLAEQQRQLAADTQRVQRRTARLGSQSAALLDQAAQEMQSAAEELASSAAAEFEHGQAAQEALEQAAAHLASEAGHEAQDQIRRELARLSPRIAQLEGQQSELLQGTLALDEVQRDQGQLSAPQQAVLEQLGRRQNELADEVETLRALLDQSAAFSFQLDRTQQHMREAARQLAEAHAGPLTRDQQQAALTRLQQLRTALEPTADLPPAEQDGSNEQGPPQGTPQPPGSAPSQSIEELKLLHLAQQDLLLRTIALETLRQQHGELSAAERAEAEQIAAEQGALADLLAELLAVPPEEAPPEGARPDDMPPEVDPQQLLRGLDENLTP